MKNKFQTSLIISIFLSLLVSCEKDPGKGGNSSVFGKVYVKDYNATFTILQDEYYGQDENVYIIYGDDKTYGDDVSTNYDGTYEFKYLRPGKYKIYAYSKDSTLQTLADIPVLVEVEITGKNQNVEAPDIIIFK
jgi:hypothetical protein